MRPLPVAARQAHRVSPPTISPRHSRLLSVTASYAARGPGRSNGNRRRDRKHNNTGARLRAAHPLNPESRRTWSAEYAPNALTSFYETASASLGRSHGRAGGKKKDDAAAPRARQHGPDAGPPRTRQHGSDVEDLRESRNKAFFTSLYRDLTAPASNAERPGVKQSILWPNLSVRRAIGNSEGGVAPSETPKGVMAEILKTRAHGAAADGFDLDHLLSGQTTSTHGAVRPGSGRDSSLSGRTARTHGGAQLGSDLGFFLPVRKKADTSPPIRNRPAEAQKYPPMKSPESPAQPVEAVIKTSPKAQKDTSMESPERPPQSVEAVTGAPPKPTVKPRTKPLDQAALVDRTKRFLWRLLGEQERWTEPIEMVEPQIGVLFKTMEAFEEKLTHLNATKSDTKLAGEATPVVPGAPSSSGKELAAQAEAASEAARLALQGEEGPASAEPRAKGLEPVERGSNASESLAAQAEASTEAARPASPVRGLEEFEQLAAAAKARTSKARLALEEVEQVAAAAKARRMASRRRDEIAAGIARIAARKNFWKERERHWGDYLERTELVR